MNWKNVIGGLFLVSLTVVPPLASAGVTSINLPEPKQTFRPGPGAEVVSNYCVICHSSDYIEMQPPMGRDKWLATVNKMRKTFGCPLPEEEVEKVADYLNKAYGTGK